MFKNDALKSLAPQVVDLNELIQEQAKTQTGTVPPIDFTGSQFGGQKKGKAYTKSRPYNSVNRHK